MFVEYIGLPASGKTTLAKKTYEDLSANNEMIYPLKALYEKKWFTRNFYKSMIVLLFCVKNIKTFNSVIFAIRKSKQAKFIDNFRLSFNFLFFLSVRKKYEKYNNKIVIFDEGFVHHIWAVSVNSKLDFPYTIFKSIIKKLDLTIKVDCPKDIVKARMQSRIKNNQRHSNFINEIDRINDKMQEVIDFFSEENYFDKLITIKNNDSLDINLNVNIIKDYLEESNRG